MLSFRPSCLGPVNIHEASDVICSLAVGFIGSVIAAQQDPKTRTLEPYYQRYIDAKSAKSTAPSLNLVLYEMMAKSSISISKQRLLSLADHVQDASEVFVK